MSAQRESADGFHSVFSTFTTFHRGDNGLSSIGTRVISFLVHVTVFHG